MCLTTVSHLCHDVYIMLTHRLKTAFITVRVDRETHTEFVHKAYQYGPPSDVLRELIHAFIEDRISITPPVKSKGILHHD